MMQVLGSACVINFTHIFVTKEMESNMPGLHLLLTALVSLIRS